MFFFYWSLIKGSGFRGSTSTRLALPRAYSAARQPGQATKTRQTEALTSSSDARGPRCTAHCVARRKTADADPLPLDDLLLPTHYPSRRSAFCSTHSWCLLVGDETEIDPFRAITSATTSQAPCNSQCIRVILVIDTGRQYGSPL